MSASHLLKLIEQQIGHPPQPSPETHLPMELHLQRFLVPIREQALYHVEADRLVALNLSGLSLTESQLGFLAECSDLQSLNLSGNALENWKVPDSLTQLEYLELSENQSLRELHFSSTLSKLRRLNLRGCSLTSISFPAGFPALEMLELQQNELESLKLPAGFDKLFFVDLKNNRLRQFKAEGQFPEMHTLYLEENQLTEIGADFLLPFPNLVRLRLEGNPLHEAILSNINENSYETLAAIQRYVADMAGGSAMDRECKVLLLGNGNVGKSCLVQRLVYDRFESEWHSTHAISLEQYPEKPDDPDTKNKVAPYLLNLWDFGGQDIYHATHRLFMQANAVSLVLWDWETENKEVTIRIEQGEKREYENHSLHYWLSYARSQGEDSPVIVVQTKTERDGRQEIPGVRTNFQQQFTSLEFRHIESKENLWPQNGYNDLVYEIKKAVEIIKEKAQIPAYWIAIRQQIRELQKQGKKRWELHEFYHIAAEVQDPMDVLRWLTQSGVVFYKPGLFNDEIILDQAWAIEAVYTLFDREEVYYSFLQNQRGAFSGKDLSKIWKTNSEAERELFISFMLSCELCFETTPENENRYHIPFAERTFIAPQLLPPKSNTHELIWQHIQPWHIHFEHEFLHYGVIQSFIVRTRHLAKLEDIWKTGILLTEGEQMVQVEAWDKRVEVKARPGSRRLLAKIRKELAEVQAKEFLSVDGQQFVPRSELEKWAGTPNTQIESRSGEKVPIQPFLPLLGISGDPRALEAGLSEESADLETLPRQEAKAREAYQIPDKGLPKVYFSYSWGDSHEEGPSREDIVDALYDSLETEQDKYQLFRDKANLEYGELISQFMDELAEGDLVVVFISDKYIRSSYCMFELYETARKHGFDKQAFSRIILPIRVEALNFDDPMVLDIYHDHWEAEKKKWKNFIEKRMGKGTQSIAYAERYQRIQDIEHKFGDLSAWLADINAKTLRLLSENDFQRVKTAIEARLSGTE